MEIHIFVKRRQKKVVDYLLHHKFSKRVNKQLKGRIIFESCPYPIFMDCLDHQGKDGVL
jgi:hypothetical protein